MQLTGNSLIHQMVSQLRSQEAGDFSDLQTVKFKPASHWLYEWKEYWLDLPGVDKLLVGSTDLLPRYASLFRLCFENHLGLTRIQPLRSGGAISEPIYLEVISRKLQTIERHQVFYLALLDDLYKRAARLPFTFSAETGRSVIEALKPPTPLFVYHFLQHNGEAIRSALAVILLSPHRVLSDEEAFVPLGLASSVDPAAILDLVRRSSDWVRSPTHPLSNRLNGFVPSRVLQNIPQETFDTPENRFVRNFILMLQQAADGLLRQEWWKNVSPRDQRSILETRSYLHQTSTHPFFDQVGEQRVLPLNSQVLMRKDGYRQLLELWQKFQQARRPLYEPLRQAIDTRSIDKLYEFWVFFALTEEIGQILGELPTLELKASDSDGLKWTSTASFGHAGALLYNYKFRRSAPAFRSYSTPLQPDYTWKTGGKPAVIFDAKFRLSFKEIADALDDSPNARPSQPVLDDLYKMHAYRDALGLRAAIILYPGTSSILYSPNASNVANLDLRSCLLEPIEGIGAVPFQPVIPE